MLGSPRVAAAALVATLTLTVPFYPCAAAPAFKDTTVTARYARDRSVHFIHTRLEIQPDFKTRSIAGTVTHTVVPLRANTTSLSLDCSELTVTEVTDARGQALHFTQDDPRLTIDLDGSHGPQDTVRVSVRYHGSPSRGVYFNEPDALHPHRPMQLFTQGEAEDAHFWIPCWDSPGDKMTTELLATVPQGMMAISNGKLLDTRPQGSLVTYHWYESVPHSSYLTSLIVGDFKALEDTAAGVPVISYVKPADYARGRENLGRLADMVRYFSQILGVPYPYEKYSQTYVAEFPHGGMENISATTNTETALPDRRARLDQRPEGLIAHELAHQWFGDLVTCRDWAHAWLNEGFATYFQMLYYEHWLGPDELTMELLAAQETYFNEDATRYRRPLVEPRYANPEQMFDRTLYQRGAWTLHMLRRRVGDELFFKGLNLYLTRHRAQPVETDDLRQAFEATTGYSLEDFFQRWVYRAGYPDFRIRGEWKPEMHEYLLHVRQAQTPESQTPVYTDPLEFEVWTAKGMESYSFKMDKREATFAIALPQRPLNVRFDPRLALLKKAEFTKPEREWLYQLRHPGDAWSRIAALRGLGKTAHTDSAILQVGMSLRTDPFWGVRRSAAEALGEIHTPLALRELLDGLNDRESRVRRGCITALTQYRRDPQAIGALVHQARDDSSYAAQGEALTALARGRAPEAYPEALRGLTRDSYNEVIRVAALSAIGETGEERGIAVAQGWTAAGKPDNVRVSAINALGILARENREQPGFSRNGPRDLRDFVTSLLPDPNYTVRAASAEALGRIGDPEAIPVLERLERDDPDFRVQERAARAIEVIHSGEGERAELKDVRRRLAEVEATDRDEQRKINQMEGILEHK